MQIDFVSDIVCPWCAIGLASLRRAIDSLEGELGPIEIRIQPFELNPAMAPEGEDLIAHLGAKYRLDADQVRQNQAALVERGRAVGFAFGERTRIHNTFDGHRLLHWAGAEGPPGAQLRLKEALLGAYHGRGRDPSARAVLLEAAASAGLDPDRAAAVLDGGLFADAVRAAEAHWRRAGISAVPAAVIDGRYLVSGGQPPEAYAQALRQAEQEVQPAHGPAAPTGGPGA